MAEPAEPEDLSVKYTSILPMTTSNLCVFFTRRRKTWNPQGETAGL